MCTVLEVEAPPAGLLVRVVRDVAPNKVMMCATFVLPADVAFRRASSVTPVPCAAPPDAHSGASAAAAEDRGYPAEKRARVSAGEE